MKLNLTLGSDPELHLFERRAGGGRAVSSIKVLKQNKHNPIILADGIKMYSDNVLTEFSFPPSDSIDGFIAKMRHVFRLAQDRLGDAFYMVPKAAVVYGYDELGPKPKIMEGQLPEEWEIGCNPSKDAYAETEGKPAPFQDGVRTGSFHIHVGDPRMEGTTHRAIAVKLMDIYVGCAAVVFENDSSAHLRRKLYGKAGDFRCTPYGVEYRTLGNWSLNSPELVELVLLLVVHAMHQFMHAQEILKMVDALKVQEAINTNNRMLAAAVLNKIGLPYALSKRVHKDYGKPNLYESWSL